jgi:hypothetical protein
VRRGILASSGYGFEGGVVEHRGDGSRGWGGTSPATVRNAILVMLFSCCRMRGCGGLSGLAQIFVANMTGNTVLPGLALGQAKVQAALRAVVALAGFVVGVGAEAAIFGRGRERSTWSSSSHSRSDGSLPGPNRTEGVSPDRTADPGDGRPERRREAPGHPRRSDDLHNRHPDEPDASSDRPAVADAVSNDDSSERETPSARGLVLPADVWLAYGIGAVIVGILAVRWSSGMISVPVAIVALVVATMTVCFHRRR